METCFHFYKREWKKEDTLYECEISYMNMRELNLDYIIKMDGQDLMSCNHLKSHWIF